MKKNNVRNISILCFFFALLTLYTFTAQAALVSPTKEFYVNDYANILSPETESHIIERSKILAGVDGTQIVVVTIPNLEGDSVEEYATELFRDFGIGDAEKNNGLLLLLSLDDRKFRVEVGYGLEGILPDGKTGAIQDKYLIPFLRENLWDLGLVSAYDAFHKEIVEENNLGISVTDPSIYDSAIHGSKKSEENTEIQKNAEDEDFKETIETWCILGLFICIYPIRKSYKAKKEKKYFKAFLLALLSTIIFPPLLFILAIAIFLAFLYCFVIPLIVAANFGEYLRLKKAYTKYSSDTRHVSNYTEDEKNELRILMYKLGHKLQNHKNYDSYHYRHVYITQNEYSIMIEKIKSNTYKLNNFYDYIYIKKGYSRKKFTIALIISGITVIFISPLLLIVFPTNYFTALSLSGSDGNREDSSYDNDSYGDSSSSWSSSSDDDSSYGGDGDSGGGGSSRDF